MINGQIRDKEVRVIGENGEQLGIMSSREAMKIAQEAELDLVKVAPKAQPPVCKIIDYGKYRYELSRKEKEAKKKQKTIDIKEVRLSPVGKESWHNRGIRKMIERILISTTDWINPEPWENSHEKNDYYCGNLCGVSRRRMRKS